MPWRAHSARTRNPHAGKILFLDSRSTPSACPGMTVRPMPKITYIEHDGAQHTVEAELGATVMETALRNDITSIVAECGGSCTCATCLVHVDEKWFEVVGPPSQEEEEQLDAAFEVKPTSRLSCQIKVTEALGRASCRERGVRRLG